MRLSGHKASSHAPRWSAPQRVLLLSLLGVNVAVFAGQEVLEAYQPGFVAQYLGLSYRGIDQAYAWQFLSAMFLQDETGRRPANGSAEKFKDPHWRDNILFYEFFHADTGAGTGCAVERRQRGH